MAQNDLLEGDALVAKAQDGRAPAADRPGRKLDEPRPALVVAQLGMDGTFGDAERAHGAIRTVDNRFLQSGWNL